MAKKAKSDAERRLRQCERLSRVLRTLQLITGGGRWDVDALAAELECSRRTVHRILQTLSMAGVPWYYDQDARAYKVRPGYKFSALGAIQQRDQDEGRQPDKLRALVTDLLAHGAAFRGALDALLSHMERLVADK